MDSVTHHGFEITHNPRQNPCAPYFIRGLRMFARSPEHACEIIDAHLNRPVSTGPRIVAADVRVVHGLSASACRNRIEEARAQKREGGRFA